LSKVTARVKAGRQGLGVWRETHMFDPAWLDEVPSPPPRDAVPPEVADVLDRGFVVLEERRETHLFPAYAWTVVAAHEVEQIVRLGGRFPFAKRVAAGFFEPEVDRRSGFGVVVYVDPPDGPLDPELEAAHLDDDLGVFAADQRLPVTVRVVTDVLETSITAPSQALVAVWTAVGRSTRPREGWLLPFHAVGTTRASLAYSDGHHGRVVDSFGYCWDAVLASSDLPTPPSTAVTALDVLPPGMSLQLVALNGTHVAPTLMDVDLNLGLLTYDKAPLRMTYDWDSSVPGDSGSLVSDGTTSAPVAMHQGSSRIRDATGAVLTASDGSEVRRGFGLCLFQIQAAKEGEFFV
jgi:hypothetical protein